MTATFALIHLAPGDPLAGTLDDPRVTQAVRDHWRHIYGFDRPLPDQYVRFVAGLAHGELGYSIERQEPVRAVLARAIPNTLVLMGIGLLLSFILGIGLGVVQAMRSGSLTDRAIGAITLAGYSLPDFWLAQLAILAFAVWLPLFPAGGVVDPVMHAYLGPLAAALDRARHVVLPALTLTALSAAAVARYQRSALLDVAHDDYLRTARAKGLSERQVMLRHALRNAAAPVITLFGLALPGFLGGQVFIEKVFAWPGLGALAVDAVATRDYAVVVAVAIVGSVLVAVGSFVADLLAALVDPRRRADAIARPLPSVPLRV